MFIYQFLQKGAVRPALVRAGRGADADRRTGKLIIYIKTWDSQIRKIIFSDYYAFKEKIL